MSRYLMVLTVSMQLVSVGTVLLTTLEASYADATSQDCRNEVIRLQSAVERIRTAYPSDGSSVSLPLVEAFAQTMLPNDLSGVCNTTILDAFAGEALRTSTGDLSFGFDAPFGQFGFVIKGRRSGEIDSVWAKGK